MGRGHGGTRAGRGGGGNSWPSLTGSEKQIAWANEIRTGAQEALNVVKGFATTPQAQAIVSKWESQMKSKTDAKSWIDSRYDVPKAMTTTNPNVMDYVNKQNQSNVKTFLSQFNRWLGS